MTDTKTMGYAAEMPGITVGRAARFYARSPRPTAASMNRALFHYTSIETLQKIIATPKIHLTHSAYLNDPNETWSLTSAVVDELNFRLRAERTQKASLSLAQRKFIGAALRRLGPPEAAALLTGTFIFSLSLKGDDLSQWRAYAPQEGVSIEFDVQKLRCHARTHNMTLEKVEYGESAIRKPDSLSARFAKLKLALDEARAVESSAAEKEIIDRLVNQLVETIDDNAPLRKREAFEAEAEVRVIADGRPFERPEVEFKPGPWGLRPYLTLPIAEDSCRGNCIASVTVGPTSHPELTLASVKGLVQGKLGASVHVRSTQIQLRVGGKRS